MSQQFVGQAMYNRSGQMSWDIFHLTQWALCFQEEAVYRLRSNSEFPGLSSLIISEQIFILERND